MGRRCRFLHITQKNVWLLKKKKTLLVIFFNTPEIKQIAQLIKNISYWRYWWCRWFKHRNKCSYDKISLKRWSSHPPYDFFHFPFYNYLKHTQILSWGLNQAEHLGCFSNTDAFVVALLEQKERRRNSISITSSLILQKKIHLKEKAVWRAWRYLGLWFSGIVFWS